jgi:hypothetical protein
MIQAFPQSGLRYAVRALPGVAAGARPSRAAQSAAAETLLAALRQGARAGAASKAHARGLVAAACAPEGPVGIDLEYCEPKRDIAEIGAWLMGAPAPDDQGAYRAFTYREAYFKALGDWPARTLLRVAAEARETQFRTPDGLTVRFERVAPDFVLTLIWNGAAAVRQFAS